MSDKEEFQRNYRDVIGLFATGVTVLLTEKDGEVRGMTANAVTSLSLDPTLLIVCPSKASRFAQMLEVGASFSVNILGGTLIISCHFRLAKLYLMSFFL